MSSLSFPLRLKASGHAKTKATVFVLLVILIALLMAALWVPALATVFTFVAKLQATDATVKWLLTILTSFLAVGCIQVLSVLLPIIAGARAAVTVTERGLENLYVQVNFLAFNLLLPVRVIPWEALKLAPTTSGQNTTDVCFTIIAKALPADCASASVKRTLKNAPFFSLSVSCHAEMTAQEAQLIRERIGRK